MARPRRRGAGRCQNRPPCRAGAGARGRQGSAGCRPGRTPERGPERTPRGRGRPPWGAHRGAALVSLTVSRRPSPRTVPGVQCPEARANGTSPGGRLTRGVMTRPGSQAPTLCSARRSRASDSSPVGRQTSEEEGPHPLWSLPRRNPVFPRTSNICDTDWPSPQPPLLGHPLVCAPFSRPSQPQPQEVPWQWPEWWQRPWGPWALKEQTEGNPSVIKSRHLRKARQNRVSPLSLCPCSTGADVGAVLRSAQWTVLMTAPPLGRRIKERGPQGTESISRTQRGAQACDPYRFMVARTSPSPASMGPKQNSRTMKPAADGHYPVPQGPLDARAGRMRAAQGGFKL